MSPRVVRAVTAAALSIAVPLHAAVFEARLRLPDGGPAVGHVVSVVGTATSVATDGEGVFRLEPAPAPPFRLVVAGPGGELSAPIEVSELSTGRIELELRPVERDSVTVVSGVAPGLDLLPASAATVVSAEALEQKPPQRLVDALDAVAGASKLGEGADSVPALRGLARGRTLILVDGARVTAERRAGPSATFVDPASLSALEVLRGPGSVVYGSDAFGGVVQAVTRDPEPDGFAARFAVEAAAGGQPQRAASAAISAGVGKGGVLLEAHGTEADDAEGGDGAEIFNSGFAARGGALRYLVPLGSGRLRASLQADRVDDLGKAAIDSRAIRAVYPREDSDRLVLSWLGAPGETWDAVEATLFYGTYRVVLDRDRAPTATSNRRLDQSDTDARDASLRALAGRELGGGRWQVGVDVHSRFDLEARVGRTDFEADATTVARTTESVAIADAEQRTTGLFSTWTRPLADAWTLGVGLRGDRIDTENRGGFYGDRSESADALSGNLSLTRAFGGGWNATAQVARGFRAPTLSDRYLRGPSGRGFVVGNPDLEPERATQLDLALRRIGRRGSFALYGYRYRIDDLIERYGEGSDFFFRNRGQADIEGIEAELQAALGGGFTLDAGAAWTRARADGGDPLDDAPAPNGWVGGRWAGEHGYGFVRAAAFLAKDDPGPTELARPGYGLLDLGGGWRFTESLELRLTVRNALDRGYTGAADEAADRAPGRTLMAGLSGRF